MHAETITAALQPAVPDTGAWTIKATAPAVAARLGALVTIPQIPLEMADPGTGRTRPPRHVWIQVHPDAANVVWMTSDNVTTPVVDGPGMAVFAGEKVMFELWDGGLDRKTSTFQDADHPCDVNSAIQLIAAAETIINVGFWD